MRALQIIKILLLLPVISMADVPMFDVVKLKIDESILYMRIQSKGLLKNGDFCYYNHKGEYLQEATDVIYTALAKPYLYDFYKELHKINFKNIPDFNIDNKNLLFVLKSRVEVETISSIENVEIISIENGNTYGYSCSEDLVENDNKWLVRNKFEIITEFQFSGDMCNMRLYAIEGQVGKSELVEINTIIQEISKEDYNHLKAELHKLYKRKIIMLGFCSC